MERTIQTALSRRTLLKTAGGALALSALDVLPGGGLFTRDTGAWAQTAGADTAPFTLGVASGDPLPRGVVLWTRLAPEALDGGGMGERTVPVEWEIAADESFARVVQRGTVLAGPEYGHSVHVDVQDLRPSRWYWYRFKAEGVISPVGRTRTAPARRDQVSGLNFAFASCQQWQVGYYTAYRHMAEQDLDFVVHLGDYIYEAPHSTTVRPELPPEQAIPEPLTDVDYRNRYALYKSDVDLQAAHAVFPFIVTWDDHEVENNYASDISQVDTEPDQDPVVFQQRRAAAYKVWYEHMPVRASQIPAGPDLLLYRRFRFGNLAEFNVMDTRQYRSDQACGDMTGPRCDEVFVPERTLIGADQEKWLLEGLVASQARWNVMAQQVPMAKRDFLEGPEEAISMDKWDGYPFSRDRVLSFAYDRKVQNLVSLAGDVHNSWVNNLKIDYSDDNSPLCGTEFVGTSITSGGDGSEVLANTGHVLAENPHIRFFQNRRGFVQCHLSQSDWTSHYKAIDYVAQPGAPIYIRASFVVESNIPGAQQSAGNPVGVPQTETP